MAFSGGDKPWVFTAVHFAAASFMVLNLAFAAASHAFPTKLRTATDAPADPRRVLYVFRVITACMALGIVFACVAIPCELPYAVIGVEVWEILFFMGFWVVATRTEWLRAGETA